MSVQKVFRLGPLNIVSEGIKPLVNLTVPLMDSPGRIVGDEDINSGERGQRSAYLPLFVEVMPSTAATARCRSFTGSLKGGAVS